jgi:ABC-2 type transport system permease protein
MAYGAIASAFIRSRLQYRVSFAGRLLALALSDLTPILLIGIVLSRFGKVAGWDWPQLALLYGLSQTASALARCFTVGLDHFEELVVTGDFDGMLTRPLSPLLQVIAGNLEVMHAGRIVLGGVVLAVAFQAAAVPATAGHLALVAAAIAGGALILTANTLAVAALAFWQTRTGKLQDIVQGSTRAFAELPLGIYPTGVRFLLTWVLPLALVTYFPAARLLGRPDGAGVLPFAAVPAGGLLLGLALLVWRAGLRRYQSTGS